MLEATSRPLSPVRFKLLFWIFSKQVVLFRQDAKFHDFILTAGVFRADIPCRFRLVPEAFQKLHDDVERCIRRAVEVEEKIPLDQVISNGPGFYKKTNIVIIFYGT